MKKAWIIVVNAVLMAAILLYVSINSHYETKKNYNNQIAAFENTSFAMEKVTENYLESEQHICDVWAKYINSNRLSMEEAIDFARSTHVMTKASAHLLYADTLTGLSTRPKLNTANQYDVSYERIPLFGNLSWISDAGGDVNVTRAYTNPVNGEQSLAFCSTVTVYEPDGTSRDALLLRVIPTLELENKWIFPQEDYSDAEFCIIDSEGNYIIKGPSFKNTNFFEFFKSYNSLGLSAQQELFTSITSASGVFTMNDARARECAVAYTPVANTGGWVLLSYTPTAGLKTDSQNWLLIGIVSAGLLLLFCFDLAYMIYFNRRLRTVAREAEFANKAKTDFLSTMSHDIRTPMNAIIGLTTIAEKNLGDAQAVGEDLRKIKLASNHLLTLINDILDISKVESGKLNLSPLTFSIVETAENLVNLSQPMIREKNIDFSFRINRMEKEYLYADQLRLNQIYINLLSNALKYTQPGGRVSVDMREETGDRPGCVRLVYVVSDTGIGMTPEYMKKMYLPFSRQTDSRVNSIQGTGLGLAITKQMVDLMNGTIDCQSEVGKGTTFTVSMDIPIADRQCDDVMLDPIDVLIVDDDEVLLETARDTLESLGARAECAVSGQEALTKIKNRHGRGADYSIVIVDWKMPGLDGIETVKRIRAEIDARLPILLISAYDWSDMEDTAKEAGVNGFISKPLFRSTLYDRISQTLGRESHSAQPEDDYSDLAGMRILIAEDNDINWEIISTMLGMFGIETQRAANGRLCLERMREAPENSFDLIFMDIQMPEMNGLDATRNIRRLENSWAANIPIIAMTADAFSENIAECLDAGMNGHIAKPVDIKLVVKEIRRIKEGAKQ